jgi:hypothetical protein
MTLQAEGPRKGECIGHDDFVNALALIHHASTNLPTHAPAAQEITPEKPQEEF